MNMEFERSESYRKTRAQFWNSVAELPNTHGSAAYGYHKRLKEIYRFYVAPGQKVIEIGCGEGDLLASLKPSLGLGIDFSEKMIDRGRRKHPNLTFEVADGLNYVPDQKFDIVIISDLVNDLWDVQTLLEKVHKYSHSGTRILINFYSRLWMPILRVGESLGLARKTMEQNWFTVEDIVNLMNLAGFEVIHSVPEVLFPLPIPLVDGFFNKFLVKIWPFSYLALTNLVIARKAPERVFTEESKQPIVSVMVPARNEAGNIAQIFERVPQMGSGTELVFVEGHSNDDTYAEIERQIKLHPEVKASLFRQTGKGKGDAVRLGFQRAKGDILMILDADLTVPPEYLPRFYNALVSGKGEFINGVRLVYPMEKEAMRFFNFLGNKFFSMAFSWLLSQSVKDTLCGTKVIWNKDYCKIAENRSYFGDFDPFGDFDLLFGAAKLNLRIIDLPIRYRDRTYGTTNIQRWKHGVLLLRMVIMAARKIKFI